MKSLGFGQCLRNSPKSSIEGLDPALLRAELSSLMTSDDFFQDSVQKPLQEGAESVNPTQAYVLSALFLLFNAMEHYRRKALKDDGGKRWIPGFRGVSLETMIFWPQRAAEGITRQNCQAA